MPQQDAQLIEAIAQLRQTSTDWGYRKMTQRLRETGWQVNPKRVYRIWREQGWLCPKPVSRKNKAAGESANACHIRKAQRGNQVWAIDFVKDRTMDGRTLKILTILDEYTREAVAIEVRRSMGQRHVRDILHDQFAKRGVPEFIRSDNGGEFAGELIGEALKEWGSDVALIAPGSPWQNGKNERFNGILSQEVLSKELWGNVLEAQVVCNQWRHIYNTVRPHGSLGLMTPSAYAEQAFKGGDWHLHRLPEKMAA